MANTSKYQFIIFIDVQEENERVDYPETHALIEENRELKCLIDEKQVEIEELAILYESNLFFI